MIQTWIHRIKPGMEPRLRDWLAELSSRSGELRESLSRSGVRAEQAFVLSGVTGSLLVYVSEADDQQRAAQAFADSQLAIDVEHRQVLAECIEHTLTEPPAYDVAV